MKKIIAFVVRHGETSLNKNNDFRGDIDVPLDADGKKQAAAIVPFFKNKKFSGIYGSTRKRVAETLAPLLKDKKAKMKPLKALDSLNTGEFAGKPKDKDNLDELKWYREHPEETIPGGEKVANFRKRVDAKMMDLLHRGESGSKPVLIGAHGSIVKEIGRLLHHDMDHAKVEPGGIVAIYKSPSGYSAEPIFRPAKESEEVYAGS
jgi:broad specificity phosphatase PhoE